MKKIIILCFMAMLCTMAFAQTDVTTFLGIPVDGFKNEMKQKLKAKGFVPRTVGDSEYLEGEFNGSDVHIYIATNNNKVYRLMVCDANSMDEANIKIRFNRLVNQFENNKRYTSVDDFTLPESEDISYEMTVHKKKYDAIFYQNPDFEKIDTSIFREQIQNELLKKYSQDQINNPTEEITEETQKIAKALTIDLLLNKPVWFRICEFYGKYYITMFYDNEYNHANGDDL